MAQSAIAGPRETQMRRGFQHTIVNCKSAAQMTASSGTPQLSQVRAGYLDTSGRPKAGFPKQIAKISHYRPQGEEPTGHLLRARGTILLGFGTPVLGFPVWLWNKVRHWLLHTPSGVGREPGPPPRCRRGFASEIHESLSSGLVLPWVDLSCSVAKRRVLFVTVLS